MRNFGAQDMVSSLKKVLMKRPQKIMSKVDTQKWNYTSPLDQYLIKENIILIPPTEMFESSGMQEVPAWIKNAAGWWSEGQIDDITYISGIQYLVQKGIIVV